MIKQWIISLIDGRLTHYQKKGGSSYVSLTPEDEEILKEELLYSMYSRIDYKVEHVADYNIKDRVTEVVDEVIDKTEVIEKLVQKVNNVQLGGE